MPSARLIQQPATLYAEPNYNTPLIEVPVGGELELGPVKKAGGLQWVSVVLRDGRQGFLPGNTRVFTRKPATLLQDDVVVRAAPAAESAAVIRIPQNARFELVDQVPGQGGDWVRVRDVAGNEGFIPGNTKVKTGPAGAATPKEAALKQMQYGGLWCLAGIAITAVTYSVASDGGGTYLVMWGPVIFGGWRFLKGLIAYMNEA